MHPPQIHQADTTKDNLLNKINGKTAVVGIIGLGYVGLPLGLCFAEKKFHCIGFDIDRKKTDTLSKGESYIKHIPSERIRQAVCSGMFSATTDFSMIAKCDAVLIAVPTPLNKNREPDMSYIVSTCETIAPYVRSGQLFVLESTTYPGTTDEVVIPILESTGLKCDVDFFAAFSPEREDPNNKEYRTETIPKVVGATSPDGLAVADKLYSQIVVRTVPVSSTRVAEATKLMENIFRSVNIALVNELKVAFMKMGIDVWEVIEAAKTKPFGYMPFYPGPGLGGHCIPIDPFYLTWKAREYGVATRFIELAGEINTSMPDFVVQRVMEALNDHGKALKGSKILMLGLAYKANVDDDRESPSYHLIEKLEEKGATVSYNDPFVPVIRPSREWSKYAGRESVEISNIYDLILIATPHDEYRRMDFSSFTAPIVDTRNMVSIGRAYKA
ncbi:MAG: nucleotide sugar dehydrogenase [Bacteroidetes bacterium]|nr:nucleotide sugar dehydrogenase [Bacteroidota bacterium]MCW5897429.1 nucleotide sugar dehydrogenase [Bacteroidota bacterium]